MSKKTISTVLFTVDKSIIMHYQFYYLNKLINVIWKYNHICMVICKYTDCIGYILFDLSTFSFDLIFML